jgi:hypothetical protein
MRSLPSTSNPCYYFRMNTQPPPADVDRWLRPDLAGEVPEPGYDEALEADLAAGLEDIKAGRVVPLEDVFKEFGLA